VTTGAPKRGDIWLIRLDPTEGREIRKTRPCLVVTPDDMNGRLGTILVMPMTTGSRPTPFRVKTEFRGIPGLLLGDHVRSVSKSRLLKRIGAIDDDTLSRMLAMLREMFED
jgi:mRNA interferase MazF